MHISHSNNPKLNTSIQKSKRYFVNVLKKSLRHTKNYLLTRTRLQLCLEIRSRKEEAINSRGNRIYSLIFFYFILYRRRFFLLVSELIQYACQRRPEIRLRSQAIRVNKYTKIQGSRFQRNYIIAKDPKSYLHGTSFQSSPKINRMLITGAICIQ